MLKEKKRMFWMCGAKNIKELYFEAKRGIGQGGGHQLSTVDFTLWHGTGVDWPQEKQLHVNKNLQEYSDQAAINTAIIEQSDAYIDNLTACSASPQAEYLQQLGETWLFSFCAFFGLTIDPGKIKSTIVGKAHPMHNPQTNQTKQNIVLQHWQFMATNGSQQNFLSIPLWPSTNIWMSILTSTL
jgi:hypothetical protein